MLRLPDHRLVLSASDLTSYLACGHLIEQKRARALGERGGWPKPSDPHGELARTRGDRHEREQLERLRRELGRVADLSAPEPRYTREWLVAQTERTVAAMREGAPLIYQGLLFDGRWQGRLDFLRRVEVPSPRLGAYSYEVLDTKLARQARPYVVHQLALYNRLLGEVQGYTPGRACVILGDGTEHAGRARSLRRPAPPRGPPAGASDRGRTRLDLPRAGRALRPLRARPRVPPAPRGRRPPVASSPARGATSESASSTSASRRRASLAAAPPDHPAGSLGAERLDLLRHQATPPGRHLARRRHAPPAPRAAAFDRGYARLPRPDAGDVFFDLEGDPYVGADGGIEYLWGWWTADGAYECAWAHDPTRRRRRSSASSISSSSVGARTRACTSSTTRRTRHPSCGRCRCGTPPARTRSTSSCASGVLVDLYAVVRQGMQVGEESYSLKQLERHTGFVRLETTVREGGGSIVAYERWLETGDPGVLEAIRAYNEEDCAPRASCATGCSTR